MQIRNWYTGAVVTIVAGATIFTGAAAAHADPSGYRTYPGVGSDTIQDVDNGLAAVVKSGSTLVLGSYDATGSATIQTRAAGNAFNRPDGSGAGVAALKAAQSSGTLLNGTTPVSVAPADIAFARSSSAPSTNVPGGTYSYIPLAVDAVTYARNSSGSVPTNIPSGVNATTGVPNVGQDTDGDGILDLTLANIYSRTATTTLEDASGTTYTVGNAASGAAIVPLVPQSNSGTRKFWLKTLTGSETLPTGSIVEDTYDDDGLPGTAPVSIQENDGSAVAAITKAIVPFSIAQWVAQSKVATTPTYYSASTAYGVTVTDRRHAAQVALGQVDSIAPISAGKLNTNFTVKRAVFHVVKASQLASDSVLNTIFATTGSGSVYDAKRPGSTTTSVISDFGFGDIPSGGITIFGKTYVAGNTTAYGVN